VHGGRFNAKGASALYLALTIDGMFAEMGHGFPHRFRPLTVCSYDVDVDDLADLRDDVHRKANNVRLAELACPWKLDLSEGRAPASWMLAERLLNSGHSGILVPSFAHGAKPDMANLVLWKWGPDLPHKVEVHDPGNRLPRNQTSWS